MSTTVPASRTPAPVHCMAADLVEAEVLVHIVDDAVLLDARVGGRLGLLGAQAPAVEMAVGGTDPAVHFHRLVEPGGHVRFERVGERPGRGEVHDHPVPEDPDGPGEDEGDRHGHQDAADQHTDGDAAWAVMKRQSAGSTGPVASKIDPSDHWLGNTER